MEIRQLHPLFVGEVSGIDLSRPVDEATRDDIVAALDRYAVLVFHDQKLTDERQIEFSGMFGPLGRTAIVTRKDYTPRLNPHFTDISNLDENNRILELNDRRRMVALGNRLWHTDHAFRPIPSKYSLLHAHAVPPEGGETEFADMRAAWDELPDRRKAQVEGMIAMHSLLYSREVLGFTDYAPEEVDAFPPAPHPLVRTHPGSGRKALYVASYASEIRGMPVPDGRMLLRDLTEHATQRKFVYTHHWKVGDLLMWDNRSLMHRAGDYDMTQRRDLRRTTVMQTEPTVAADQVA
jgi:alpha-ketoglutarate-dependent 2,4-dichlorophenoxyacetate dioxygenase